MPVGGWLPTRLGNAEDWARGGVDRKCVCHHRWAAAVAIDDNNRRDRTPSDGDAIRPAIDAVLTI